MPRIRRIVNTAQRTQELHDRQYNRQFLNDPLGFLAWAKNNYDPNPTFCARHWMPCPVYGKNGIMASTIIMQIALQELMPSEILENPEAMNYWVANRSEPLCCSLGDARMEELWDKC